MGTVPGPAASLWSCRKVLSSSRGPGGLAISPTGGIGLPSLPSPASSGGWDLQGARKGAREKGRVHSAGSPYNSLRYDGSTSSVHLLCARRFVSIIILKVDGNGDDDWSLYLLGNGKC